MRWEMRRVPLGWQYSKDEHGRFISLFDQMCEDALTQYKANKVAFENYPDEQAVARESAVFETLEQLIV